MNPLDQALARVISARNVQGFSSIESYFPPQFGTDLVDLLEKKAEDPNRWLALASGLGEASLHAAAAAAFWETLNLLVLAKERAKVFVEWARIEEASGQTRSAAAHYEIAHRLDRDCTEARERAQALNAGLAPRVMLGQWDVLGAINDPMEFARLAPYESFPRIRDDILRAEMAQRWFQSSSAPIPITGTPLDCSFVVTKAARPVLLMVCDVRGDRDMACHEVPIVLAPAEDAGDEDIATACDLAFQYIADVARLVGAASIHLEEPELPVLTPVSIFAARRPSKCNRVKRAYVDLTQEPAAIWNGVRKGHRHAINWGKSHLELRRWDGTDGPMYRELVDLYDRAGRTPSFRSPEEVRPFWSGDAGELVMAYLDGVPMAAVATTFERESAYYMAGVSVDHGEVPSSHWPLYQAILRAREKGLKTFQFGYLETDDSFSEKKRAIAHFKGGFTKQATKHLWWAVSRAVHSDGDTAPSKPAAAPAVAGA